MNDADLSPAALFDLTDLPGADVFADCRFAWDALGPRLKAWLNATLGDELDVEGTVHEGAWVVGRGIRIGPGTVVEPGAYIRGPCWIGANVQVRHGAYLRGTCLIGDGAVVGHATEAKGSIFLPGAKAGHFAYVGDSILGRDTNLGAGTKLANLRLAADEVTVRGGDGRWPTGLRKLGAILGDGAQTGCNVVTNPGTVLGRGALVHPGVVAGGAHPPDTVLRPGWKSA